MQRKGQAAMEFLMTYGWAILAAIIAIGVLAYFGVFSPGKFITGAAVVNPPFYANAWNIQQDANDGIGGDQPGIVLELRNNGGEDYNLYSVTITGTDSAGNPATCTYTGTPDLVSAGNPITTTSDCGTAVLTAGKTFKGDVTVSYRKVDGNSQVDLTSTGTIAEKITA
ncbi:hypothetical protein COU60_05510 [Candidatus Pacearchaeota archaeon CG10_big_fil_rev_8_21_14_0_10_34_76]|nr:MAG: hypothetical protein COU60_05510 [Candidatus Pacearchaeota archaeon CG10_big_fil_rev_8_21_14_0_10_34_76]